MEIWYLTPYGFQFNPTPPFYFMDFYKSKYVHKLHSITYNIVYVHKTILPLPSSAYLRNINEIYPDFENGLDGTFPLKLKPLNGTINISHISDLFETTVINPSDCASYILNGTQLAVPPHVISFALKSYQKKIISELPTQFIINYKQFPLLYALLMRTHTPYTIEPDEYIRTIFVHIGQPGKPYHKHVIYGSVALPMRSGYYNGAQVDIKAKH